METIKKLPLVQQKCLVSDVETIVRKELESLFSKSYYDRSVYYLETKLNPLKDTDLKKYNFDSLLIAKKYGTADCVGISKKFQEDLSRIFKFQLIPATSPLARLQKNMPKCTHSALIIWCKDGYVLTEPGMNIATPIIFKEKEKFELNLGVRGKWEFILDIQDGRIFVLRDSADPKNPWSEERKANYKFEYYLGEVQDPDNEMAIPHFVYDRNVLICPFTYPDECHYFMTLQLEKKIIEYSYLIESGAKEILTIPFETYYDNPDKFETLITDEISSQLHIPRITLIKRIETVMDRVM